MSIIEIAKIQIRRGQEIQTGIPQLDPGEFGWAQDTEHLYIGKRIAEGANSDANTRILTENDQETIVNELGQVFRDFLHGGTDASTSTYQYRAGAVHIHSTGSTVAAKLDNFVSLTDYGVEISFTATDITTKLRAAVNDIFKNNNWNAWQRTDARRKLIIPAGNYQVSSTIELPPYTTIVGEGQELTSLTLMSTTTNMFRTIDAQGNAWVDGMSDGVKRSREVIIQGMTLQYSTSTNNAGSPALVALDNVLDAKIEDVFFKTLLNTTSTTTYGIVGSGIGISIRGQGGGIESGDTNLCENIQINRCRFDSLYTGIECTGTVVRPVVTNSVLSNLNRGISIYAADQLLGPTNGLMQSNRFKSIVREAIFVGTSTNRTMHASENNYFVQVGNGPGLDDFVTTSSGTTAVITFKSEGNKTINDYFHRRSTADNTTSTSFYYNPFVLGRTTIDDGAAFTKTVGIFNTTTQGITSLSKFPLSGSDQMVSVRYKLSNSVISRKGNIVINIASDGYVSLTDTYNFTANDLVIRENITTATTSTIYSPTQFVVNTVTYPEFVNVVAAVNDGTWFIVDTNNNNNSALITGLTTSTGNLAVFATQSAPVIEFTNGTAYTLARAISSPIVLNVNFSTPNVSKNYVTLFALNGSTSTATISTLEYNINILQ